MSRDDWYRHTTWTEDNRAAFFARLNRCRSVYNKSQCARIQASILADHGHHVAALQLLDAVIDEYPDRSQLALAHLQKADCHAKLGDSESAIMNYRKVFDAERGYPNVQTPGWLKYPWYVVESNRVELFAEALEIIRSHEDRRSLSFPIDIYRWAGVKAILAQALGQHEVARQFAEKALEASNQETSGFRYHPDVGLVRESGSRIHEQLMALIGV